MSNHSGSSSDSRKQSPDRDPYLVSIVSESNKPAAKVSENTAVVLDELGITSSRRRISLLLKRVQN